MTTAEFHTEGRRITGFTVRGHSGYAPEGEDIVCAAVTSAVRLVECAVNDVLGLEASVKVRQKDASITLKLPAGPLCPAGGGISRSYYRFGGVTHAEYRSAVFRP